MRIVTLGEYRNLMHAFSTGRIGAGDFKEAYLHLFKEDRATRPQEIFRILEAVFKDVGAFSPDPADRGRDGLDDSGLQVRVTEALRVLDAMRHGA
jgi:hypothetical protein